MAKRVIIFISIISFSFHLVKEYLKSRPTFYHEKFNAERKQIGLATIKTNWERNNSENAVYQKWTPQKLNPPCFFSKYINCDSKFWAIVAENDNYLVYVDSSQLILSVNYPYRNNSENLLFFELREVHTKVFNTKMLDLFGHPGRKIRNLTKKEADQIMKENKIIKPWN